MEKKIAKKTYEILKVMTFALRANVITGHQLRFLPFMMGGKLCVVRIPCENDEHVGWDQFLWSGRVAFFKTCRMV
jgi:hypothetical protein